MWPMGGMMFGMAVFWILLILLAIWLVKQFFQTGMPDHPDESTAPTAMEILEKRYSRGEITREQYEQMKKDLSE